jgi:hypothetical protein
MKKLEKEKKWKKLFFLCSAHEHKTRKIFTPAETRTGKKRDVPLP